MTDNETAAAAGAYPLSEAVDIASCEALWSGLAALPKQAAVIDASKVERITTPGLQALLAFGRAVEAAGGKIVIQEASKPFAEAGASLGFSETLASWGVHYG